MLERGPLGALRLRDRIAQAPEILALALVLGDRDIADEPFVQCRRQFGEQRRVERFGIVAREFDQRIPGAGRGEWRARLRNMAQHRVEARVRDDLEPFEGVAQRRVEPPQQDECLVGRFEPDPRGGARGRDGNEAQAGRRHDSQRALGAAQQVAQVVTAVVLLQRRQTVEDATVGQHRLDSRDQRAHRAVAQHLRAAGVGRDEPSDRRRPLAAEGQRKAQPVGEHGIVEILEHHAGLDDRQPCRRVDGADAVEPPGAEQQLRAGRVGSCAADHAAVAALRHDRGTGLAAQPHRRRHLFGRGGRQHRRRGAVIFAAPVGQPRRENLGIGHEALGAQQRGKIGKKRGRGWACHRVPVRLAAAPARARFRLGARQQFI